MSKTVAKRGDYFYYLEVWNKQEFRDNRISSILDEPKGKIHYVNGSLSKLNKVDKIELALFWKNKSSAENRIKSLKLRPLDNYHYVINSFSREEFISKIPDKCPDNVKSYQETFWLINKQLKDKEVKYKKKLENPWRDFKLVDLGNILNNS